MFAYAAAAFVSGFVLFLLGFSIFMYYENRKFGDNQFTMKLLPPPSAASDGPARPAFVAASGFRRLDSGERIVSKAG